MSLYIFRTILLPLSLPFLSFAADPAPPPPALQLGTFLYPDKPYDFAPGDAVQVIWTQTQVVNTTFQLWCYKPEVGYAAVYSTDIVNDDLDPYLKFNIFLKTCQGTDCYFLLQRGHSDEFLPTDTNAELPTNYQPDSPATPGQPLANPDAPFPPTTDFPALPQENLQGIPPAEPVATESWAKSVNFNITLWDSSNSVAGAEEQRRGRPPPSVQWSFTASPPEASFPEVPGSANDTCGNGGGRRKG